jgi:hypothetical protein
MLNNLAQQHSPCEWVGKKVVTLLNIIFIFLASFSEKSCNCHYSIHAKRVFSLIQDSTFPSNIPLKFVGIHFFIKAGAM